MTLTQQDDGDVDDGDEVSLAAMQTTLTLLLRYQRLLMSRFIADDMLQNLSTDVLSLSGITDVVATYWFESADGATAAEYSYYTPSFSVCSSLCNFIASLAQQLVRLQVLAVS